MVFGHDVRSWIPRTARRSLAGTPQAKEVAQPEWARLETARQAVKDNEHSALHKSRNHSMNNKEEMIHARRICGWCEYSGRNPPTKRPSQFMKNMTLVLTLLAAAILTPGCNKEQTASEQLDKAQAETRQATRDMKDYTYAQKSAFVAAMEGQLAALNRDLDQLPPKSKLQAIRSKPRPNPSCRRCPSRRRS